MRHCEIKVAIIALLRSSTSRQCCRVLDPDVRIRVAATAFQTYPDASVVCGSPRFGLGRRDYLQNPTWRYYPKHPSVRPGGEKFAQYKLIPSLREYVLAWQTRPRIELFRRQPDGTRPVTIVDGAESTVELESIAVRFRLGDIYDGIEPTGRW